MQDEFITLVYNTLNGLYRPGCGVSGVENAFLNGSPCMELYSKAYDAYQRIRDRLDVVDEDDDVEDIFHAFSEINRIMCIKMFQYGAQFSRLTPEEMQTAARSITTD